MKAPQTLHAADLIDVRASAQAWGSNSVYSSAFRAACRDVADRITAHLAGQGDDKACARAIERLFGRLGPLEIRRLQRAEALFNAMSEAFDAADARGWARAFKRVLDELSESQIEALMHHVAVGAAASSPTPAWPAIVHAAPQSVQ